MSFYNHVKLRIFFQIACLSLLLSQYFFQAHEYVENYETHINFNYTACPISLMSKLHEHTVDLILRQKQKKLLVDATPSKVTVLTNYKQQL